MTDTFCPIPWVFQAVRSNGDIRVCCQANITKNKGVLRKPDGVPYNAGRDDPVESRNSDLMQIMRRNMLDGVWSDECARCQQEEESGLSSRRVYESRQWDYTIEQARAETTATGRIDTDQTPIRYYDLRFGNLCNLACRMCGPTDSNSWYSDWVSLTGSYEFSDTSGPVKLEKDGNRFSTTAYDWHHHDGFWTFLEANLSNLEHVYMAGGEPLLIDRHYEFLQKCIDSGDAQHIVLEYNTNATTLPPRVLGMWAAFKNVRVGASIDGFGDMLEYQRYPAKWKKVLRNLQRLNDQPSNITVWLAYTVTAYNAFHLTDFIKWKLSSGLDNINRLKGKPLVTHHVAHHPKHLNIRVFPDAIKEQLRAHYGEFTDWVAANHPDLSVHAAKVCDSVLHYMDSDTYHDEHWDYFKSYTQSLDLIRGQSFENIQDYIKIS